MKPLFFNDPEKKAELLQRARDHRAADDYEQGSYIARDNGDFKGCAVACLALPVERAPRRRILGGLRAAWTRQYGNLGAVRVEAPEGRSLFSNEAAQQILYRHFAVPPWITRVADTIFETLDMPRARRWPERLVQALPVGAEISAHDFAKVCAELPGWDSSLEMSHLGTDLVSAWPEGWSFGLNIDDAVDLLQEQAIAADAANSLLRWLRKQG